jgi:hypothetical protein
MAMPALDDSKASPDEASPKPSFGGGRVYYGRKQWAYEIKAGLQMVVGLVTLGSLVVSFAGKLGDPGSSREVTTELLGGIGVGLAAAAVIDLAYTLFTPGPDEALDPLMLGLAATMLVLIGGLDDKHLSLSRAAGLLVLGILLAVLFATRLWLAETEDDEEPEVWWVRRRLGLPTRQKQSPGDRFEK